jgi:hypothetical protein
MSAAAERRNGAAAAVVLLDRDNLEGGPSTIIGRTVASTVARDRLVHHAEAPP